LAEEKLDEHHLLPLNFSFADNNVFDSLKKENFIWFLAGVEAFFCLNGDRPKIEIFDKL